MRAHGRLPHESPGRARGGTGGTPPVTGGTEAEQEIARERERLDKERAHYVNALRSLTDQGKHDDTTDLRQRLTEIDAAIEHNEFRAANIRAGTVYVISNVGVFGQSIVKIGMTRRIDPMERVRELGDASVPFPYDAHAVFWLL